MCGDLFLSVMNDCDRARPCNNGTTDATCTLMPVSSRRFNANRTATRHQSHPTDAHGRRSSRDSDSESRVDDNVGEIFIWKSDHDLEGTF